MMNRKRQRTITQVAQAHQLNLQKSLQHRLETARAKGDENLIRLLQAEANYIGIDLE